MTSARIHETGIRNERGQLLNQVSEMLLGGVHSKDVSDPKLRAQEAIKLLESIRSPANSDEAPETKK